MSMVPALRHSRAIAAIAIACFAMLAWAAPRADASAFYSGTSADGSKVFFTTTEQIVPSADTDNSADVYQRSGNTTLLISFGPFGGTGPFDVIFEGASADGSRIYFTTSERLVEGDTDSARDVYERAGGQTTLVSVAQGSQANVGADFFSAAALEDRVLFTTTEPLLPADVDTASDIYSRVGSTTTLLSPGTANIGAQARGASADATRLYFVTSESLDAADADSALDIYRVAGGALTLVSTGPAATLSEAEAAFGSISADGMHAFFETSERLVAADTDESADVYEHDSAGIQLVSGGDGAFNAGFVGTSADGTRAYLSTSESLSAADQDLLPDIYERAGGQTTLISTSDTGGNGAFIPSFNGASSNGSSAFFTTDEVLDPADTDTAQDIYRRSAEGTDLISTGPVSGTPVDVFFSAASADGTRVLFTTTEALVPEDTDTARDAYRRSGDTTTLVSTGPNGGGGDFDAVGGATPDLSVVFVQTAEHLTADDTDGGNDSDVFAWSVEGTVLITAGGQSSTSPNPPVISSSTPPSPSSVATPRFFGTAPAGTVVRVYLTPSCTGLPAGTINAAEFPATGVEIQVPENATSAVRATATDNGGNTSPCSSARLYVEDSLAPGAPSIGGTSPPSPANFNAPKVSGAAEAGSTVRVYETADCSGTPRVTGSQQTFASPGLTVTVADDSTTPLRATATDAAGNVSACSSAITYVEDSTTAAVPVLTATDPPSPANQNEIVVSGTAQFGTTVRLYKGADCAGTAVATVPAVQLTSPGITVTVADDSQTTFRATATSSAGNASACSAPLTYTEDSTGPTAPTLTLGSRARSDDNRVVIRGQAAGATIFIFRGSDCQGTAVASGTMAQLSTGFTIPVAENNTVVEFRAVAKDVARNPSACSQPLTYTEDSIAPKTRITFGPAFKTRDRTPTFRFLDESEDPTAWFQCKVDRQRFKRCNSPKTFKNLKPGRHIIQVRARDAAGNKEAQAVKRRFRVVR